MKLVRFSSVRIALVALLTGAALTAFQNCSSPKDFNSSGETSYPSGNGGSYEGKTYHHVGQCADGSSEGSLILKSAVSALLTRSNCQPVTPALPLGPKDFTFDPNAPTIVTYNALTFVIETQVANKIAYVQRTEYNSGNDTLSYTSPPFASPLTAGNLIACSILVGKSANVVQVSDSTGNTYQRAVTYEAPSNFATVGGVRHEVWYAANVLAGSVQITVNLDNTPGMLQNLVCSEYSGLATTNPVEGFTTATGASAGRAQIGPISSSAPNTLMFSALITRTGLATPAFNMRSNLVGDVYFDSFLTSASPITAEVDVNSDWMGAVVLFRSK